MTLEQLLNNTPENLEKLGDKELNEILLPYFPTTRPEAAKIKEASRIVGHKSKQADLEFNIKFKKAQVLAKSFGIDLK